MAGAEDRLPRKTLLYSRGVTLGVVVVRRVVGGSGEPSPEGEENDDPVRNGSARGGNGEGGSGARLASGVALFFVSLVDFFGFFFLVFFTSS